MRKMRSTFIFNHQENAGRSDRMGKTVVIVDDSRFLIKQISDFFEKQLEFTVCATGFDGNDAVTLYRKYKPDLITLDITGSEPVATMTRSGSKARTVLTVASTPVRTSISPCPTKPAPTR